MRILASIVLLFGLPAAGAVAQFKEAPTGKGPSRGGKTTTYLKLGVTVNAIGTMYNGIATVTVPDDWPEQSVRIVKEDVSPTVGSLTYRQTTGGGGVKQMVVQIPQLRAGQEAHALVTFEVTRTALLAPTDTSIYSIPNRIPRELMLDVSPSPYIESRHPAVVAAAREAIGEPETDWQKVEALYDWTRGHVTFKDGPLKGAARGLIDKEGYTDELAGLFIALCRVHKIPARTVFVPGHCYAEFYLDDDEGQGHWFPCQPAGARSFGGIDDVRPILQKGDSFKTPETGKERLRWVKEFFHAAGRGGAPRVKFVNEPVEP